ncbi:MAG: acetyl/propionyl/methylcrotonyl-CoA carboxylase subunit alpha [Alphaproteobacteria bacterium]|nr:MAG: acetyl/propionyl/methylcrotonyl-CoA carboxylase subunit alpha [Alphaproteobacteria bacterium]
MFKKILIANRGEIACRVIKTARLMGIKTVAVYSEADRDALHVKMADEAVFIGPAAAAESYLVMDKILDAVEQTKAEAVHPGYGFLSENAVFANELSKRGIAFIGPNVRAIQAMGDKIESKKLAAAAGVSTIPGHMGVIKDAKEAVKISQEVGYPVMLKASAGGGGKGMRIAFNDAEAEEGFTSATNEAISSFGDDRIFVEKFIEDPRHIEIQVLGDKHGNIIYLGERECSIQRRHQKVIEEAPSPFLNEDMRKQMGEQAVALAQVVDYDSAGTVEMIVDPSGGFYFLEMNTRLQVEHPVTELITGVDLVEQMIRSAYGEVLNLKQEDIHLEGWAIESRVYAEDPLRNFLPSIGRISRYSPPTDMEGVRIDTGIEEGSEISMYYDPMIAKLCTYAPTREEAISRMSQALDAYYLRGISHNVGFLSAVMAHPRFKKGDLSTNFIAEEYPDGFQGANLPQATVDTLIAVALVADLRERSRQSTITGQVGNVPAPRREDWVVNLDEVDYPVTFKPGTVGWDVFFEGRFLTINSDWLPGQPIFSGLVNGAPISVEMDRIDGGYRLTHAGASLESMVRTPRLAELAAMMPEKVIPDTSRLLLCPMPGLIVSVAVEEGDEVFAGQPLAVVEAMKMENILRAEKDAVVAKVLATPGDSFAVDQVIMEFE